MRSATAFAMLIGGIFLTMVPAEAATRLPYSAAQKQAEQQCFEAIQLFRPSILFQRILMFTGKPTPEMLANNSYATDDEAGLFKLFIPANQTCDKLYIQLYRTYGPRIVDLEEKAASQRQDIYQQVADKKLTYGQATHMIVDINRLTNAKVAEIYPPAKPQSTGLPSESDAAGMMQAPTGQQ